MPTIVASVYFRKSFITINVLDYYCAKIVFFLENVAVTVSLFHWTCVKTLIAISFCLGRLMAISMFSGVYH